MLGLARYALRGQLHAGALTSLFIVLSGLFPPIAWLSGALISVTALRRGPAIGLQAAGLAIVLSGALFFFRGR